MLMVLGTVLFAGNTEYSCSMRIKKSLSTRGVYGIFGMQDEGAEHPDHLLHRHMGVVEISAFLIERGTHRRSGRPASRASVLIPGTPSISIGISNPCQ